MNIKINIINEIKTLKFMEKNKTQTGQLWIH